MSSWLIYWVLMLDGIKAFFAFFGVLGTAAGAGLLLFLFVNHIIYNANKNGIESGAIQEAKNALFRYQSVVKLWPMAIVGFLLLIIAILIPNTNQMALIYVIPKVSNNEQVQQIPDKLLGLANKQLDEWVSDFKKQEME